MSDNIISWNEWEETYKPVRNPNNPDTSFWGCMFETHGTDVEYIKSLDVKNEYFWTLVDNNPNSVYLDIVSGAHAFNRMGYFITEVPWKEGVTVSNDPSYKE